MLKCVKYNKELKGEKDGRKKKERFSPGRIVATKRVADQIEKDKAFEEFCEMSLRRHLNGDWGKRAMKTE